MHARKTVSRLACTALLVLAPGLIGCQAAGEAAGEAGSQQEWAWLQERKQQLEGKRAELASLRQQLRDAPVETETAPAAQGAAAAPGSRAELEAGIAALEQEIATLSDEFGGRLVAYINSFDTLEGEAMPPEQQQAIRMKSDEDIELAQEWIEKGGDYRRAIEIYETQRQIDPGYEKLEQALAKAQEMRYMTEERFAQVTKGMTQSEVRQVLGPVNLHNVMRYDDRGVEAWFYPKEGGGAAGVYFRLDDKTKSYRVYQTSFNVKSRDESGAQAAAS